MDHAAKQVVLTCRGTLSFADCLKDAFATDLALDEIAEEFGVPSAIGQYGHKGIFQCGAIIARHVERLGYLRWALTRGGGAAPKAPPLVQSKA